MNLRVPYWKILEWQSDWRLLKDSPVWNCPKRCWRMLSLFVRLWVRSHIQFCELGKVVDIFLCFMFVSGMHPEPVYCRFIFQMTFLFILMDALFFITFIYFFKASICKQLSIKRGWQFLIICRMFYICYIFLSERPLHRTVGTIPKSVWCTCNTCWSQSFTAPFSLS
jgi:hypothetical protein